MSGGQKGWVLDRDYQEERQSWMEDAAKFSADDIVETFYDPDKDAPLDGLFDADFLADVPRDNFEEEGDAIPHEQWTDAMRVYAQSEGCIWRTIDGHPVCIQEGAVPAYVGTHAEVVSSIKRDGIQRPVFLTTSIESARARAAHAALGRLNGRAVVAEISIPLTEVQALRPGIGLGSQFAFTRDAGVPAAWIVNLAEVSRVVGFAEVEGHVTCYAPLVIVESEKATVEEFGFDPNQPRDVQGRWAETGEARGESVEIHPARGEERAFRGESVDLRRALSKAEVGALSEAIGVAWLRRNGYGDAKALEFGRNNFPLDLIDDHKVIEVKGGLVSNRADAQKWRLTIGEPGAKEKAWLARAGGAAKTRFNDRKMQAIFDRKVSAMQEVARRYGKRIKGGETLAVILDSDRGLADVYRFRGFHASIRWSGEEAQRAYRGTVKWKRTT